MLTVTDRKDGRIMKKIIRVAVILVLMLSIVPFIEVGPDAAAESTGKYVSDLRFWFKQGINFSYRNRISASDIEDCDLILPDGETEHDVEMDGECAFAYAKAYVKRTDDASQALRDITIRTDLTDGTEAPLRNYNQVRAVYDLVLPKMAFYNALYTTRNKTSGDPICDVYFVKDSLDVNGVEYACNRVDSSNRIPHTSYAARMYEMYQKTVPVYTVFLRDNIAKKYVSKVTLVKGDSDKKIKKLRYEGYDIIRRIEAEGQTYLLATIRTDSVKEAVRGVYFVKQGSFYSVYTSKSEGAGTPIVDICSQSDMIVEDGETTTLGDWTRTFFQGDDFKLFVKDFIVGSDTSYRKNRVSDSIVTGEMVKEYDNTDVMLADAGYEQSILDGVDVEAGSHISENLAVVRRIGKVVYGDIVINGWSGIGTSDPEKLAAYHAQVEQVVEETSAPEDVYAEGDTEEEAAPDEEEVGAVMTDETPEDVSGAAAEVEADTTGSMMDEGKYLWVLIPVVVVMIGAVVFIWFRRKKNAE